MLSLLSFSIREAPSFTRTQSKAFTTRRLLVSASPMVGSCPYQGTNVSGLCPGESPRCQDGIKGQSQETWRGSPCYTSVIPAMRYWIGSGNGQRSACWWRWMDKWKYLLESTARLCQGLMTQTRVNMLVSTVPGYTVLPRLSQTPCSNPAVLDKVVVW